MIDWDGEVQMRHPCTVDWEDVTILCPPIDGYVWLKREKDAAPSTWCLKDTEFRNKPQEPKRVQGWLCLMKNNEKGTYHIGRFLHDTRKSAQEYANVEYPYASCVAIFEIDVTEGQGGKGIQ